MELTKQQLIVSACINETVIHILFSGRNSRPNGEDGLVVGRFEPATFRLNRQGVNRLTTIGEEL